MKKLLERLNNIKINQTGYHVPENTVEIDGKMIEGIRNVKIEYGINFGLPIVTVEFYAKVSGHIGFAQGVSQREIEPLSDAERIEAWDRIKPKKKVKFWKRKSKRLSKGNIQENVRDYVEKFNIGKIKERDKQREEKNDKSR